MDAFDVLRNFVEDIESEYPSSQDDSGINVERLNWPDLMITYRRAKAVLSKRKSEEKFRRKITCGSVIQAYDDNGNCTSQEFVPVGAVDWIDEDGKFMPTPVHNYQSFDMVQP